VVLAALREAYAAEVMNLASNLDMDVRRLCPCPDPRPGPAAPAGSRECA
jgi:hypothetical protein